jgi:TPR repeat protein
MLELITVASRLGLWTGNYRGSDCFCRRIAVAESLLAFSSKQPMLVIMEKSWLGKMFSTSQKPKSAMVPATVDLTDAEVQFGLGLKFASGTGAAQDYAQAADWYRKAAEQNHGLAQFNLGTMYARGQGVARDDAQSVVWFGRAANLGDAGGQYNMGRSCQRASMDGLPADAPEARIEAYKWFQLAAAQGYKNSEGAYATLTFKMTRADVAEAIERVARFSAAKESKPSRG